MGKEALTVRRLLDCGFQQVGCWELNAASDLTHKIELPARAGVYAFAIDGAVQYVGLASKSVRQRLGFYRKPGSSQLTNVRLNELIRGHIRKGVTVEILIAHPPDFDWNGLKISGSEGLEAGIISRFHLPWNKRGSDTGGPDAASIAPLVGERLSRAARILALLRDQPGLTGGEIARAIYGPNGTQPQVNPLLHKLISEGTLQRRGLGRSDPYRYYLVHAECES